MVQKEVADRLAASPASGKDYGSLSVAAQHAFAVTRLFTVPPGAFHPPPKVDSAVVRLVPRAAELSPPDEMRFLEHVKRLFTRRRKLMLPGLLKDWPDLPANRRSDLENRVGGRRAEALTPQEHLAVFRVLMG
jgi:16S rRNA (adenine1518-N6/adenine1519-N6)-dimethyltransferase